MQSASGAQVPLSAVAHYSYDGRAADSQPSGCVPSGDAVVQPGAGRFARPGGGSDPGDAAAQHVPPTLHGAFQGTAQAFQASLSSTPLLVAAAILVVYIVLGMLYESFIHPITILSALPSAGVGALLMLMLFGYDLSLVALIGIILLIGIVKKNAIMMIDFALVAERDEGKARWKRSMRPACCASGRS